MPCKKITEILFWERTLRIGVSFLYVPPDIYKKRDFPCCAL